MILSLEVDEEFITHVRSLGRVVDMKDLVFPFQASSVNNVITAIQFLGEYSFCCGNDDEKYFAVQAERKGIFKDPTGNCFS